MSTLTNIERLKLEKIFESPSGAGYVLDFSNRTFQDFILNATNKDIYLEKYAVSGTSKANRLRVFWDIESDSTVGKLISELLDYWKTQKLLQKEVVDQHEQALFDACKGIAHRLLGVSSSKEMTEDEFIQKTFKNVSISKINLDAGIIGVLDQRLSEIKKCLTANAPLAVIFLCGSTLEGILLGVASNNSKDFNIANSSPKDKNSGKVLPFKRWTLANFIDVAAELRLVGDDVKKFSHALRDFRNYIHPHQQMVTNFDPDKHTAEICWTVLQAAISQLSVKS